MKHYHDSKSQNYVKGYTLRDVIPLIPFIPFLFSLPSMSFPPTPCSVANLINFSFLFPLFFCTNEQICAYFLIFLTERVAHSRYSFVLRFNTISYYVIPLLYINNIQFIPLIYLGITSYQFTECFFTAA